MARPQAPQQFTQTPPLHLLYPKTQNQLAQPHLLLPVWKSRIQFPQFQARLLHHLSRQMSPLMMHLLLLRMSQAEFILLTPREPGCRFQAHCRQKIKRLLPQLLHLEQFQFPYLLPLQYLQLQALLRPHRLLLHLQLHFHPTVHQWLLQHLL